jgi:hypothetical protein
MLVLQSCRNSPKVVAGLYTGKSTTLSGDVHEGVNINVEVTGMDIKVEEIPVVKVEEGAVIDIKEEEIPCDVTSRTVKAEEDQVSYTSVCPLLYTFYENSIMPVIWNCICVCLLFWPHETSTL